MSVKQQRHPSANQPSGVLLAIGFFAALCVSCSFQPPPASEATKDERPNSKPPLRMSQDSAPVSRTQRVSGKNKRNDKTDQVSESERGSRENLRRLRRAIQVYALLHRGQRPRKLSDLYYEDVVTDTESFFRPGSGSVSIDRTQIDARTDYTCAPLPGVTKLVIREKQAGDKPGRMLAAFEDGVVRWISTSGDGVVENLAADDPLDKSHVESSSRPSANAGLLPSVIGMSAQAAKRRLNEAGFSQITFAAARLAAPSKNQELTIHEQEPAGGTRVGPDTVVKLSIYPPESAADSRAGKRGTDFEVPNVVGLSAQAARNAILEHGLRVEIQAATDVPATRQQAFTVQSQSPPTNVRIQPAGTIIIRVYPPFQD
jgi:hypothetical protein